jgi:predicted Rossmann fold flavoprotein
MCAAGAGSRGRNVLLLDHSEEVGAKILISGGGRCNFTNREIAANRFLSENRHFCKSALARYTQDDFVALVEAHGIAYHEKTLGQLFCDGPARQIVDMLLTECRSHGVDLRPGHAITEIAKSDRFRIETRHGGFTADALVIATGGLSIPKLGATGFAYDIARQFGVAVVQPRPGLVPLTVAAEPFSAELAGVSLDVVARGADASFREAMLVTHRGLSGPAILQISSYLAEGDSLILDLLPDQDAQAILLERKRTRPKAELRTILGEFLPQRLAQRLVSLLPNQPLATLADKALIDAARLLKAWPVMPTGTEGYAKAEVTAGGIDTAALSSQTMQARNVPGLYFIGEAVDVTGWLGGYNFQWAWSSGWVAGQSV